MEGPRSWPSVQLHRRETGWKLPEPMMEGVWNGSSLQAGKEKEQAPGEGSAFKNYTES